MATVGHYAALILMTPINAVAPKHIVSANYIWVAHNIIQYNISAWYDISMMGYDVRMVYHHNNRTLSG